jgi:hypothetical protein
MNMDALREAIGATSADMLVTGCMVLLLGFAANGISFFGLKGGDQWWRRVLVYGGGGVALLAVAFIAALLFGVTGGEPSAILQRNILGGSVVGILIGMRLGGTAARTHRNSSRS